MPASLSVLTPGQIWKYFLELAVTARIGKGRAKISGDFSRTQSTKVGFVGYGVKLRVLP